MKTFIILLILSASTMFGQNTVEKSPSCSEPNIKSVSSRGIRLGMDQEETLRPFSENGKLTIADGTYLEKEARTVYTTREAELQAYPTRLNIVAGGNFGYAFTRLVPKDAIRFEGVARYEFAFLDRKLAVFSVSYLKPKWENRDQFIRKISEILGLPIQEGALFNNPYRIKCGNYYLQLYEYNNEDARYSMAVSVNIDEILTQRRKKAEDEQREIDIKTFKP